MSIKLYNITFFLLFFFFFLFEINKRFMNILKRIYISINHFIHVIPILCHIMKLDEGQI